MANANQPRIPLRGSPPPKFIGEPVLTDSWLRECFNYFDLNETHFTTDKEKILTALTWFDTGIARLRRWKEKFEDEKRATNPAAWGTWSEFTTAVKKTFSLALRQEQARAEYHGLQHPKGMPMTQFRDIFIDVWRNTGFTGDAVAVDKINRTVNPGIIKAFDDARITLGANATFEDYLEELVKLDINHRTRNAQYGTRDGKTVNHKKVFGEETYWSDLHSSNPNARVIPQQRDPNAMDVDRFEARRFPKDPNRPVIPEHLLKKRREEGLCYDCGEKGCGTKQHYYSDRQGDKVVWHSRARPKTNARAVEVDEDSDSSSSSHTQSDSPESPPEARRVRVNSTHSRPSTPPSESESTPQESPQLESATINLMRVVDTEVFDTWQVDNPSLSSRDSF